jgi:hypothetical protein
MLVESPISISVLQVTLAGKWQTDIFKELENRVLRRIFIPNTDKITRQWRRSYNNGLHELYSSPVISVMKLTTANWA